MEPEELRERVLADVRDQLAQETGISRDDRQRIALEVTDDILGHGPLERLLADETVTEIMVNGPYDIWIERGGRLYQSDVQFNDESQLRRIINKMVAQVGRRIDEGSPMVDARLPDGSRVNAVIPPLSLSGPLITIRKFSRRRLTLDDMIKLGTLSSESVEFLQRCIQRAAEHAHLGRNRLGQDDVAQRALDRHPRRGADRHDRGRSRAPAQPDARAAARGAAEGPRGRERDPDPCARAQLAAHAARPDHRRRGSRPGGARHAPGDEHRPRRLAFDDSREQPRATHSPASRRWC